MMRVHLYPSLLLLILASHGVADDAIQCPPCSQEKLIRCLDPTGCQELVKEPGCGCCATCALPKGSLCGVYTARCGSGLRCFPTRGTEKPLHALMQGQGVCTDISEIESIQESFQTAADDDLPYISYNPCGITDKSCMQKHQAKLNRQQMQSASRFLKTINNQPVIDVRMGPCHKDLKRALDRLSSYHIKTQEDFLSIPIPNCDRNGFYNSKQCDPALNGQRGKCWCVDSDTGNVIHVTYDPILDPDCQLASKSIRN
ncbi:insulin-like growth factor-binding protein 4 [Spea bombifrons]|uniref:insulin-like growth factor-binding protein 4 n=1 Tax=Spea bombifrons TaxID=233779 RepID=UPI002349B3C4|nr:insulin-like growth factor-binding protein 4 [Spea bombifrons]